MKQTSKSLPLLELTSVVCAVLLCAALINEAYGQGQGRGHGNSARGQEHTESLIETSISIGISIAEARELAQISGLTGRQSLPPGIARNLGRGKALPPGIAKQVVPGAMLSRLPRIEDHEWVMVGTDLVLVAVGTAIVVSILDEVFQ